VTQAPVALPMVLLVKRWAKIEGLNKAYEKTLTLGITWPWTPWIFGEKHLVHVVFFWFVIYRGILSDI
jgi:hypothetical protein